MGISELVSFAEFPIFCIRSNVFTFFDPFGLPMSSSFGDYLSDARAFIIENRERIGSNLYPWDSRIGEFVREQKFEKKRVREMERKSMVN